MKFSLNCIITSKKPHACGGNTWQVVRVGADYKLKCLTCGRIIFLSCEELIKMAKNVSENQ